MTGKQAEAFARSDARRAADGLPPVRPANAKPPMRGLGDVVKRVTDALHIPQCGGCKKRQEWLNKAVPFDSLAIDVTELPKSQESEIK